METFFEALIASLILMNIQSDKKHIRHRAKRSNLINIQPKIVYLLYKILFGDEIRSFEALSRCVFE